MDKIQLPSCPLCKLFLQPKESIKTKLYYPSRIEDLKNVNFCIIECEDCKIPMVVSAEHLDYISDDIWRNSNYQCRKLFGRNVDFRTKQNKLHDHSHYHVIFPNDY